MGDDRAGLLDHKTNLRVATTRDTMPQLTQFTPVLHVSCTDCRKHGDEEKLLSAGTRNHHGKQTAQAVYIQKHRSLVQISDQNKYICDLMVITSHRKRHQQSQKHQCNLIAKTQLSRNLQSAKTNVKVFLSKLWLYQSESCNFV